MSQPSLSHRVAIVTGASSGIGRAAALLFAEAGAAVVVGARRQAELDQLVAAITQQGGSAAAMAGDVRDEAYAQALVATAVERFGGLDIAFNNAGTMGPLQPTPDVQSSDWRDTLETNLTSAFRAPSTRFPQCWRAEVARSSSPPPSWGIPPHLRARPRMPRARPA